MIRYTCILFTSLLVTIGNCLTAQVPVYQWAFQTGYATNLTRSATCIATDSQGDVWSAGTFEGTIDADPGSGTLLLTAGGLGDCYFMKHTAGGAVLTAFSISAGGNDVVNSIAVDDSDNLVVTGRFYGTADFDPGPGTLMLTSNSFPGSYDAFIAKYDSSGNLRWAFNLGNVSYITCEGFSIATDAAGFVYVAGRVYAGGVDFDPDSSATHVVVGNPTTGFLAKYTPAGHFVFVDPFGGGGVTASVFEVTVSAFNQVVISGNIWGTVNMDPRGSSGVSLVGTGNPFVAQYDSTGRLNWAFPLPNYVFPNQSSYVTMINGLAIDLHGNINVAGSFLAQIDVDPSPGVATITANDSSYDFFMVQYDSSGNYNWSVAAGGTYTDKGLSIAVDDDDAIYVTGYFSDTADFDPSFGTYNLNCASVTNPEIFAARYSSTGLLNWAFSVPNGPGWDSGNSIGIYGDEIYVTGYFTGTGDFDPSSVNQPLNSFGGVQDAFLAKYLQDSTVSVGTLSTVTDFAMCPVPSTGIVSVRTQVYSSLELQVYNSCGELILFQTMNGISAELDLSNEPCGIYFVRMRNQHTGDCSDKKVVIAR